MAHYPKFVLYLSLILIDNRSAFSNLPSLHFSLNYDTIQRLLQRFSAMSELADNGGKVDLDTFAKYLGLPITDTLQELFDLYDTVSC